MNIHYEIKTLKNSRGEGKTANFVTLVQQQCMTAEQMETQIESASSLTKAGLIYFPAPDVLLPSDNG